MSAKRMNMRQTARWLWSYWRRFPKVLVILLVLTPIQAVVQAVIPRMLGFTIDFLRSGAVGENRMAAMVADLGARLSLTPGASFALAFVALGTVSFGLYAVFQSTRAWTNCRLEWAFRQEAFDGITRKGPDFFTRFRTGDLVTRMTDDVAEKLSWFACSGIFRLYEALLNIIFILLMMISIDGRLTLWTAGPLPLLILIFFRSSSLLDRRYDTLQGRISRVNDAMEACFGGIRVVKAHVRERAQQLAFERASEDRRRAEIASVKAGAVIDSLYNYVWQFGVVVVLVAGGAKVLQTSLSLGEMATFLYYVVWLVFPMFDVGQFLVKSRQSAVSIARLKELDEVPPMVVDHVADRDVGSSPAEVSFERSLRCEQVEFAFAGGVPILRGIDLEIRRGETVALVGRVGSGKTWLAQMLPRLVDPTGGRILLDGRDLRTIPLAALRGAVGFVSQEPLLFSDTVRNNILFGREGIPEDVLVWALEVSQLREEVGHFPQGIDTPIGTRGMAISGGQKQRLGLARALVGRPQLLVLDDCTSALDSKTETVLWDRLHQVMPEMTAVLVTHRPDTLARADRIFVLVEGEIAEVGRHGELMARLGEYARIYRKYELQEALA